MVSPPKYTKTVEVHNDTGSALIVTVTYDDHINKKDMVEVSEVANGAQFAFPVQTIDKDGCQFVAPVKSVLAKGITLLPNVTGVKDCIKVVAATAGNGITLTQH